MLKYKCLTLLMCAVAMLALAGCGDNVLESLSDDGSEEACLYQASQDLDQGNYDDVINSECADGMQVGAAYLGRAGFDIASVIEKIMDANDLDDESDDIELYLNELVGTVSYESLDALYAAIENYGSYEVGTSGELSARTNYETLFRSDDAEFYVNVIARPLYALSGVKGLLDKNGIGKFSKCDINDNTVPDEADAAACAFLTAAGFPCTEGDNIADGIGNLSVSVTAPTLTFGALPSGVNIGASSTYKGITVTIPGTVDPGCAANYKYVLASNDSGDYVTMSVAKKCTGSDGTKWNCPYQKAGVPVDLLNVTAEAILTATDYLVTLVDDATASEVSEALHTLKYDMCGTDDDRCDGEEVAAFLTEVEVQAD